MKILDWTWTGCWMKLGRLLNTTKIFTRATHSAQNLELPTTLAQNLAMTFLGLNLVLPMVPTRSRLYLRRIAPTLATQNLPLPTTTLTGQTVEASLISLLEISLPRVMETSHLKYLLKALLALPVPSLTRAKQSPAFSPVLGIFPLFQGLTLTLLSILTFPQILSSLPSHQPRPPQATF